MGSAINLACVMTGLPSLMGRWLAVLILALVLAGCTDQPALVTGAQVPFKSAPKNSEVSLMPKEDLALLEESANPIYLLGSGDHIWINVFGRPELSGKHVIGPDGVITVPLIGNVFVNGLTREQAQQAVAKSLREYFTNPYVDFGVDEYTSNQVTVLGRVGTAGVQRFPHAPTLAEVLANAGALPILDKQATLTRCAIMRGREKLIWVDLKALLNGDLAYNLRMKKGDIVFIPDSSDTAIYVMGAVGKPGSYRLTPRMTVLDAITQAGGTNDDAAKGKIGIYRAGAKRVETVDLDKVIAPERSANYALEDGDVIFVPTSLMGKINFAFREMTPAISVLTFGVTMQTWMKQK